MKPSADSPFHQCEQRWEGNTRMTAIIRTHTHTTLECFSILDERWREREWGKVDGGADWCKGRHVANAATDMVQKLCSCPESERTPLYIAWHNRVRIGEGLLMQDTERV